MAESLARVYGRLKWKAIYSSPQRRAIQTARPIAEKIGRRILIEAGLREIDYGRWEGLSDAQVRRRWKRDFLRWTADPGSNAPTGGETAREVAARAGKVCDRIRKRHRSGNVMVISHKATIRILICHLLGIEVGRYRYRLSAPLAGVSIVNFAAHGPMLKSLGDTAHLPGEIRKLSGG